MSNFIRSLILQFLGLLDGLDDLVRRVNVTEIGTTGHVSSLDEQTAGEQHLNPLSRFERWLLTPYIENERMRRRSAFSESVFE